MTNEEYMETQTQLVLLSRLIADLDITGFINTAERADAIAPILDPTLWKKGHRHLDAIKDLARGALHFQAASAKFRETMAKLPPGTEVSPELAAALRGV